MPTTIRSANPHEYSRTESVVRAAFWNVYRPGAIEHTVLHNLRESNALIPELDLVAIDDDDDNIVGVLICPEGQIHTDSGRTAALSMMVGVIPDHQRQGIGSMLIRHATAAARTLDYPAIIIFGDPAYYVRFGFRNAAEYGIQTADGENFASFMALELSPGALNGIKGRYHEHPAFQPN